MNQTDMYTPYVLNKSVIVAVMNHTACRKHTPQSARDYTNEA